MFNLFQALALKGMFTIQNLLKNDVSIQMKYFGDL